VDWSEMLGSSLSSPPCVTEVSSLQRPQTATCDKNVGSSSRQAARPAREDQRTVCTHVAPSRTGASESQRAAPRQADPLRRQLPSANSTMVRTARTPTACRGVGRGRSLRTQRRRRVRH
jgi:hypothetical protein